MLGCLGIRSAVYFGLISVLTLSPSPVNRIRLKACRWGLTNFATTFECYQTLQVSNPKSIEKLSYELKRVQILMQLNAWKH